MAPPERVGTGDRNAYWLVFRLAQHVDEAGRDDELGGVDAAFGLPLGEPSDGVDAVADHADVRAKPRRAGAVHDLSPAEQQIAGTWLAGRGQEEREQRDQHVTRTMPSV
jgi:hypothetical protein